MLSEDFLLSTFSALDVEPHKPNMQPFYPDDALMPLARPHPAPIGCTCMFVITDFNSNSGGTRVLPGSHRAPIDLLFSQDASQIGYETFRGIGGSNRQPGSYRERYGESFATGDKVRSPRMPLS